MGDWLNLTVYENTIREVIEILLVIIIGILIFILLKNLALYLIKKHEKTDSDREPLFWENLLNKNAFPLMVVILVYVCLNLLNLPAWVMRGLNLLLIATVATSAAAAISVFLVSVFHKYSGEDVKDKPKENAIHWLTVFLKIFIWTTALILFLDNIGVKISSLIAVLGVGGVAIAFAAQSILADIFCFFTIFFDKPFEIGDFIVVGPQSGTVEHIGVKTTRLRSLDGEQIVMANSDITKSRIQNYKTMKERRVLFHLMVDFETEHDKLARLPQMLEEIINGTQVARFGRAHFVAFREYYLDYEVVYFIEGDDYDEYLDAHHQINLKILEALQKEGIHFAYPTRNVNLNQVGDLTGTAGNGE